MGQCFVSQSALGNQKTCYKAVEARANWKKGIFWMPPNSKSLLLGVIATVPNRDNWPVLAVTPYVGEHALLSTSLAIYRQDANFTGSVDRYIWLGEMEVQNTKSVWSYGEITKINELSGLGASFETDRSHHRNSVSKGLDLIQKYFPSLVSENVRKLPFESSEGKVHLDDSLAALGTEGTNLRHFLMGDLTSFKQAFSGESTRDDFEIKPAKKRVLWAIKYLETDPLVVVDAALVRDAYALFSEIPDDKPIIPNAEYVHVVEGLFNHIEQAGSIVDCMAMARYLLKY